MHWRLQVYGCLKSVSAATRWGTASLLAALALSGCFAVNIPPRPESIWVQPEDGAAELSDSGRLASSEGEDLVGDDSVSADSGQADVSVADTADCSGGGCGGPGDTCEPKPYSSILVCIETECGSKYSACLDSVQCEQVLKWIAWLDCYNNNMALCTTSSCKSQETTCENSEDCADFWQCYEDTGESPAQAYKECGPKFGAKDVLGCAIGKFCME